MIPLFLLGLTLAGLIAIYMSRPRFKKLPLSAARFLHDLPPAKHSPMRMALALPVTSLLFWLQVLMVAALLGALLLASFQLNQAGGRALGLWVLVDTSYSMSTRDGEETFFDRARAEAAALIREAESSAGGASFCARLSSFDLERRDISTARDTVGIDNTLAALEPRPFGTDLALPTAAINLAANPDCPITHVAVVTDRPAPLIDVEPDGRQVIWQDVSRPVTNVAIGEASAAWDVFSGELEVIRVPVQIHGRRGQDVALRVFDPTGALVAEDALRWSRDGTDTVLFEPRVSGEHRMALSIGDAYDGDDLATLVVPEEGQVRVDWRTTSTEAVRRLGWLTADVGSGGTDDAEGPPVRLRVVGDPEELSETVPSLMIGRGYNPGNESRIAFFEGEHPILEGVNFDLLDRSGLIPVQLPEGFTALVAGDDGGAFVGIRAEPRALIVPGLPTDGEGMLDRASLLLFFNALRWLLEGDSVDLQQQYFDAIGREVRARADESETATPPRSRPAPGALEPVAHSQIQGLPLWPFAVTLAALMFALERFLAARRRLPA